MSNTQQTVTEGDCTVINGKKYYKQDVAVAIIGKSESFLEKNRAGQGIGLYRIYCTQFKNQFYYELRDLLTYVETEQQLKK